MPHLAPLNWLAIPFFLLIIIYCQQIYFHFIIPSAFPPTTSSHPTFSNWNW